MILCPFWFVGKKYAFDLADSITIDVLSLLFRFILQCCRFPEKGEEKAEKEAEEIEQGKSKEKETRGKAREKTAEKGNAEEKKEN